MSFHCQKEDWRFLVRNPFIFSKCERFRARSRKSFPGLHLWLLTCGATSEDKQKNLRCLKEIFMPRLEFLFGRFPDNHVAEDIHIINGFNVFQARWGGCPTIRFPPKCTVIRAAERQTCQPQIRTGPCSGEWSQIQISLLGKRRFSWRHLIHNSYR